VAQELSLSPSSDDLLSAEECLLECGYIEPVDIGLMRGSYSVTPAGLARWIVSVTTKSPQNRCRGA
jgi:hypothetical protein